MRTVSRTVRLLAAAALVVVAATSCSIDEGLPTGTTTAVGAEINNNGVITAWGSTLAGIRGFIKEPGGDWVNIGTIGDSSTLPEAINDSKVVVGATWTFYFGAHLHRPFRWDPVGGIKDLGTLGGPEGEATDVNNAGTIVGWGTVPAPNGTDWVKQAWYSTQANPSGLIALPSLPGNPPSYAAGINDNGDIIGWVYLNGDQAHAVLWKAGTHQIVDIGPAGVESEGHDINNLGVASGLVRENPYVVRPARWLAETHAVDYFGTLGGNFGCGNVINDAGVIVGSDALAGSSGSHAFRYDPTTKQMADLGTLGGQSSHAAGLNEAGVAVGWSDTGTGNTHVVRWTPDGPVPTAT